MDFMELFSHLWWLSYFCFIVGFILVVFEMYIPGIQIFGIVGAVLLLIGIAITAKGFFEALIIVMTLLALLGIALAIVFQLSAKGKLPKNVILEDSIQSNSSNHENSDLLFFMDKEGTTLTSLRPAGSASFDGVKLDVISDGDYIEKDSKVKIVKIKSLSIVVRKIN
ncbi:MAG: NfeD family protein [Clostridiales bacterium]